MHYLYSIGFDRILRMVCDRSGIHESFETKEAANLRAEYLTRRGEHDGLGITIDINPDLDNTRDGKKVVQS